MILALMTPALMPVGEYLQTLTHRRPHHRRKDTRSYWID